MFLTEFLAHGLRQAAALGAEQQGVAVAVVHRVAAARAAGGNAEQAARCNGAAEGVQMGVHRDIGEFVIVEAGAAQARVVELEAQRFDEMQPRAGVGAQANDVARVGRDLRLEEDDVERHG